VFVGQPGKDLFGLRFEPLDEGEDSVALCHVDRPQLAGPVVDGTEQVSVDRAEMSEVVATKVEAFGEEHKPLRQPRFRASACARTVASVMPS
jgi:hypothetical protein